MNPKLRTEVGHKATGLGTCRSTHVGVELTRHCPDTANVLRITGQLLQALLRHRSEHHHWITLARLPAFRVDFAEEAYRFGMPAPPVIQREMMQLLELLRHMWRQDKGGMGLDHGWQS